MRQAKFNILIVSYNQEGCIGRAIESILAQKEYGLHEIVICDDCSPDNTFGVIEEYATKNPGYIRAYRNEHNLGIYGNSEKSWSLRGEADFYSYLAGDDILCDGWFEKIQLFIANNHIIYAGRSIAIYSDWKIIRPNAEEKIYYNSMIADKRYDPVSLKMRGLICTRSTLQSAELMNRHIPVDLTHGVSRAETMFDEQEVLYSDENYYCPYVGSVYYSEIGFSRKTHTVEYEKEVLYNKNEILKSYNWDKEDIAYIKYQISQSVMRIKPKFSSIFPILYYYIKGRKIGLPYPPGLIKLIGSLIVFLSFKRR